jgi:uncharacterized membrane protein
LKKLLLAAAFLFLPSVAQAQVQLAWDMNHTQADAQSFTYRVYLNSATTGTVVTPVTCTVANLVTSCRASLSGLTPGKYSITLSAANAQGESAKSVPLAFSTITIPNVPFNLRIEMTITGATIKQ